MTLKSHDKIPCDFGGRRRMVRWVRFAAGALLLSSLFVVSPIIPVDLRFDVPILSQVLPQVEPVEANATCAQGGECIVGNTGPGGGIVFYVAPTTFPCGATLASTCKYLEAAPTSGTALWTDATYAWSGNMTELIGATAQGVAIGTGLKNTEAMVTQVNGGNTPNRAGTITRAYRGPNNLTDWYLPSKDELNQLHLQRTRLGFVDNFDYSSSSEDTATTIWYQNLVSGSQRTFNKNHAFLVRPVRAFG